MSDQEEVKEPLINRKLFVRLLDITIYTLGVGGVIWAYAVGEYASAILIAAVTLAIAAHDTIVSKIRATQEMVAMLMFGLVELREMLDNITRQTNNNTQRAVESYRILLQHVYDKDERARMYEHLSKISDDPDALYSFLFNSPVDEVEEQLREKDLVPHK